MAKEYAPGIPSDREVKPIPEAGKPKVWEFVIQEHKANRAGQHFDLRLGDPKTGHGHSWALRKLPAPGEKVLAKQQPTHSIPYFDFKGEIKKGYGAGKVQTHTRSKAEVLRSTEDKVVFSTYNGKDTSEYALIKIKGGDWLLLNRTPTRESWKIPSSKPKYKEVKPSKINTKDESQVMEAKLDGAHVTLHMEPGKEVRVFSYRPTERSTGVIEHTRRVESLTGVKGPPELGKTVMRAELYAKDKKTGKALPAEQVGGILNANVWKSRKKQKDMGKLRIALLDALTFKGKDVEGESYDRKLKIRKAVKKALKGAELPRSARTQSEKEKLLLDIKRGQEPSTDEGVVLHAVKGGRLTKSKLKKDFDVHIKKIIPGKKSGHAGAYAYSLNPRGKIVGNVGTGMSHSLRTDMLENPDKYLGLVARVSAQQQFQSGALRAPAHVSFHLDKNPAQRLHSIEKLASLIRKRSGR
jgi:hypothetical protein